MHQELRPTFRVILTCVLLVLTLAMRSSTWMAPCAYRRSKYSHFRASSTTKNPLLAFIEDGDSKSDNAIKIDNAFKRLQSNQHIVHVTFYRGGMYKESALYLLDALKGGVNSGNAPGMLNPRRRRATDDSGNKVASTWINLIQSCSKLCRKTNVRLLSGL